MAKISEVSFLKNNISGLRKKKISVSNKKQVGSVIKTAFNTSRVTTWIIFFEKTHYFLNGWNLSFDCGWRHFRILWTFLGRVVKGSFNQSRVTCHVFFGEDTSFLFESWTLGEYNSDIEGQFFTKVAKNDFQSSKKNLTNMSFSKPYVDSLVSKDFYSLMQIFFVFSWYSFSTGLLKRHSTHADEKIEGGSFFKKDRNFNFLSRFGQEENFTKWRKNFANLVKVAFNVSKVIFWGCVCWEIFSFGPFLKYVFWRKFFRRPSTHPG